MRKRVIRAGEIEIEDSEGRVRARFGVSNEDLPFMSFYGADDKLRARFGVQPDGSAGLAVHHIVCQTIVRVCGTPHAQTNAVMLPHFTRMMDRNAPEPMATVACSGDARISPPATGIRSASANGR